MSTPKMTPEQVRDEHDLAVFLAIELAKANETGDHERARSLAPTLLDSAAALVRVHDPAETMAAASTHLNGRIDPDALRRLIH